MNAVRVICRLALGIVWFYEGLVPKLLFVRPDQIDLVLRSGLFAGTPEFTLQLLGIAQVVCGLWLLAGFAQRLAVFIATGAMIVMIVLVARGNPALLTDPYGALIKDLCLVACAFAVWKFSPGRLRKRAELA